MSSEQFLPKSISRRSFAGMTIVGAASMMTRPAVAKPAEDPNGWIDAHVHIWSPDTARYPLASGYDRADMAPPSFTPEQLFSHCRPAGVSRIVLIQMSFYEYDHRYLFEAMENHPGVFSAVCLIDFRADDVEQRVTQLASRGARGFRLHSRGDAKEWLESPGMQKLWRIAAEKQLAVCPLINPEDIAVVDRLCRKFPETTVVVDHFARIGIDGSVDSGRLDELCRLARFPNVHVKTSAFYALGKKAPPYTDLIPMIRRVVDAFGVERLMWASDCPFQVQGQHNYEASISLIRDRIDFLSASDREWMLRKTADKVFFA